MCQSPKVCKGERTPEYTPSISYFIYLNNFFNFIFYYLFMRTNLMIHWAIEKSLDHRKSKGIPEKHLFLLHWLHWSLWLCGSQQLWIILKEMGIPDHFTCLLRNLYAGQEATELDMEQQTGSKSGKEYVKTVYCHPAYLTTRQSTSCEMPDWMNLKLESRLPGEISVTSDMQMTPPQWQKIKRN